MDAIKKKMQAMRIEKEAAHDKADQFEKKLAEQRLMNEQVCFHSQGDPVDWNSFPVEI